MATWKWDYLELGEERINTETNYRLGSFRSLLCFEDGSYGKAPAGFEHDIHLPLKFED